jgi:hypothetical protein
MHDVIREVTFENDSKISFVLKYSKRLRINSPERDSNVEEKPLLYKFK